MALWMPVLLLLAVPVSGYAYHTPEHFCEQCIADNCLGEDALHSGDVACISSACGTQCEGWMADTFGSSDGCMAQCETMLVTCQSTSQDAGGLIDDYCADMAQKCYDACAGEVDDAMVEEDVYSEDGEYSIPGGEAHIEPEAELNDESRENMEDMDMEDMEETEETDF